MPGRFHELLDGTERMSLRRIHEFTARDRAFADDAVLQETLIFTAVKRASRARAVLVTPQRGAAYAGRGAAGGSRGALRGGAAPR